MRRRSLAITALTLAFMAGGTSLVIACGWGWPHDGGAGHHQYSKPGCGPDKSDGWAGKSGQHTGQPPKDQHRGDCPHPPGQQCDDAHDKSGGKYGSSKTKSWSKDEDGDCSKSGDGGHHSSHGD